MYHWGICHANKETRETTTDGKIELQNQEKSELSEKR